MSEQAGRERSTFSGLIGAMIVLVLVVLAFVTLREVDRSQVRSPVQPVEYAESVTFWQDRARFEILAPPSLPDGWIATSVRFERERPQSWHLGVLTDDEQYVGIEQRRSDVASMVAEFVDDEAVRGEPVQVAGATWTSYSDSGGDLALVRRDQGVTTLVVGTITRDELIRYVESLR